MPSFSFPEPAAAVLGRMHAYWRWRTGEGAVVVEAPAGIDVAGAARVIAAALDAGTRAQLRRRRSTRCSAATAWRWRPGTLVPFDEAVATADTIGYPVAMKAAAASTGRSAQAGVALDLARADDVRRAVAVMREHLGDDAAT